MGHWQGDDVCKVSGQGASSSGASSSQPSATARRPDFKDTLAPKNKQHQTFTVLRSDLNSYDLHSGYGAAFEDPNAYRSTWSGGPLSAYLVGNIERSARVLEKEVDVYHALPTALSRPR